jgi:hypothetical protein
MLSPYLYANILNFKNSLHVSDCLQYKIWGSLQLLIWISSDICLIANLFNNYFLSVAYSINEDKNKDENLSMINPINYLFKYYNKPFPKINWQYASTYEIDKIIKSLKSKNTSRYNEISNCIIKLSLPFIIPPLTHICNAALNSSVFHDRLKYAIVKPIHKKR